MPVVLPFSPFLVVAPPNAGLLAVRILGASDAALRTRMEEFQSNLADMVLQKDAALRNRLLGE